MRALLKACEPGLEEVFAACEAVLIEEMTSDTLAAGRRFLARWAREVREALGLNDPDGSEPEGGTGRSRASLSPVGDRWAGDLDLSAEDGEKVANAIDAQVDTLWNEGVFTTNDGLDPSERRAIALVQVIERGTDTTDPSPPPPPPSAPERLRPARSTMARALASRRTRS